MEHITLNDGNKIPQLGLGVWELSDEQAYNSVRAAIEAGYRHIDTAKVYENEEAVGRAVNDAIKAGDVSREDLFITTKLWNDDQERVAEAHAESLKRLGLDYVDLYLIHWPCPQYGKYASAFADMLKLRGAGAKSVGVCNFYPEALDQLEKTTGEKPAVNQIEIHPGFCLLYTSPSPRD